MNARQLIDQQLEARQGKQSRKGLKEEARDALMSAIATYGLGEADFLTDELEKEIVKQKERVERLFGYRVGSWTFGS